MKWWRWRCFGAVGELPHQASRDQSLSGLVRARARPRTHGHRRTPRYQSRFLIRSFLVFFPFHSVLFPTSLFLYHFLFLLSLLTAATPTHPRSLSLSLSRTPLKMHVCHSDRIERIFAQACTLRMHQHTPTLHAYTNEINLSLVCKWQNPHPLVQPDSESMYANI